MIEIVFKYLIFHIIIRKSDSNMYINQENAYNMIQHKRADMKILEAIQQIS